MNKLWNELKEMLLTEVANHSIYVWSGQGEAGATITEAWIRSRETSAANAARAISYWQTQKAAGYGDVLRAFDCSGLIMYFFQNLKGMYADMSAAGIYAKCQKKEKAALVEGDFVFHHNGERISHVGVYMGDGTVIEAKGRDHGVCRTKLSAYNWNRYGRFEAFLNEKIPLPETPAPAASKYHINETVKALQSALNAAHGLTLTVDGKFGAKTEAAVTKYILKNTGRPYQAQAHVKVIQTSLKAAGYSLGSLGADGKYGNVTEQAVKAYQKAEGLRVDGRVGLETTKRLMGKIYNE